MLKKYWDHSTKPSTYVISFEGAVGFVGNYENGMMYIKSLENKGMISFQDDFLPYSQAIVNRYYRALMCEKDLRRQIIKLKKEIKALKQDDSNLLDNGNNDNHLGKNKTSN
jgi:hypothetical protein